MTAGEKLVDFQRADDAGAPLPRAVESASIQILGATLTCIVLQDGRRVFEAEGVRDLLERMARPGTELTVEESFRLSAFICGAAPNGKGA